MSNLWELLAEPFPPDRVHWRIGSTTKDKKKGLALAYIDARDVMERLDATVGPARWTDSYEFEGARTLCTLSIRCYEGDPLDGAGLTGWVSKTDGAGDSDIEGEKGAISDAFKRAAVKWGIGRYLYATDSVWVEIDDYKRIKKHELERLKGSLAGKMTKPAPAPKKKAPAAKKQTASEAAFAEVVKDAIEQRLAVVMQEPPDVHHIKTVASWACTLIGVTKLSDVKRADFDKLLQYIGEYFPPDDAPGFVDGDDHLGVSPGGKGWDGAKKEDNRAYFFTSAGKLFPDLTSNELRDKIHEVIDPMGIAHVADIQRGAQGNDVLAQLKVLSEAEV